MITKQLLKQWSEAKKLVKEGYGILDKEMTDIQLKEIKEHIRQCDLRIFDNSVQINSIKNKNVNSNLSSKKLNSEV